MAVCQNPGTPGEHQNSWDLWMFIPLKMVLIGIDPYPYTNILVSFLVNLPSLKSTLVEPKIHPFSGAKSAPLPQPRCHLGHCRLVVGQVHAAIAQLRRVQGEGFTTEANQALGVEVCLGRKKTNRSLT